MRKLITAAILVLLVAVVGLTSMTPVSDTAQAEKATTIRFYPSILTAEPGQTFILAVAVRDVVNLYGFDVRFTWNTTCLEYINHTATVGIEKYSSPSNCTPSPYAGILHEPFFTFNNTAYPVAGEYGAAYATLGSPPLSFNGSGTVVTIAFRALDRPGSTYLQFTNNDLASTGGTSISNSAIDGLVNIWRLLISTISPENKTYSAKNVPLTFSLSKPASWIGYSLDGQANVTISGNTTLYDLSEGTHVVTVCANDTEANRGRSEDVFFAIDTTPPDVTIISPQNKTYETSSVSLNLTVNELTSWIGYSLDGQANTTIGGNTTLSSLSNGLHSLAAYARDVAGNTGASSTIYFSIEEPESELFLVVIIAVAVIVAVAAVAGLVYFTKFRRGKEGKARTD